jgi:hypothetical protein
MIGWTMPGIYWGGKQWGEPSGRCLSGPHEGEREGSKVGEGESQTAVLFSENLMFLLLVSSQVSPSFWAVFALVIFQFSELSKLLLTSGSFHALFSLDGLLFSFPKMKTSPFLSFQSVLLVLNFGCLLESYWGWVLKNLMSRPPPN